MNKVRNLFVVESAFNRIQRYAEENEIQLIEKSDVSNLIEIIMHTINVTGHAQIKASHETDGAATLVNALPTKIVIAINHTDAIDRIEIKALFVLLIFSTSAVCSVSTDFLNRSSTGMP